VTRDRTAIRSAAFTLAVSGKDWCNSLNFWFRWAISSGSFVSIHRRNLQRLAPRFTCFVSPCDRSLFRKIWYPADARLLFISMMDTPFLFAVSKSFESRVKFGKHFENASNSDLGPLQGTFSVLDSLTSDTIFENRTAICLFRSEPFGRILICTNMAIKATTILECKSTILHYEVAISWIKNLNLINYIFLKPRHQTK
jgi:hypothetical protein